MLGIDLPQTELDKQFYGRRTRAAVMRIQDLRTRPAEQGIVLQVTGKLEAKTAAKLNRLLSIQGYFRAPDLEFDLFNNTPELISSDSELFVTERLNKHLQDSILKLFPNASTALLSKIRAEIKSFNEYDLETKLVSIVKDDLLEKLIQDEQLEQEIYRLDYARIEEANTTLAQLLNTSEKLRDHPLLRSAKQRTIRSRLIENVFDDMVDQQQKEEKTEALLLVPIEHLTDEGWARLAEKFELSRETARRLQVKADLSRMTGQNLAIVKKLTEGRQARIRSLKDLIELSEAEWKHLCSDLQEAEIPEGETSDSFAERLSASVNASFPTQHLLFHMAKRGKENELRELDDLKSVFMDIDEDSTLFSARQFTPEQLAEFEPAVQQALSNTISFVNRYRYLGLEEELKKPRSTGQRFTSFMKQKRENIRNGPIKLLETFYQNNPKLDLRYADLSESNDKLDSFYEEIEDEIDDSKVLRPNWKGISTANRTKLRKQLKVYQRLLRISTDTNEKQQILSAGFESARDISEVPFSRFMQRGQFSESAAKRIYKRAKDNALSASHLMIAALSADRDNRFLPAMLATDNVLKGLQDVESYNAWFGDQNYCKCEHCRSIFSPAAYFVDLMHYVETHISEPSFISTGKTAHSIYLKNRRPDLWTLELSCENTKQPIPNLQIVIEVLESYLLGEHTYELIKDANYHFDFPINIDYEASRVHLDTLGTSRLEVSKHIHANDAAIIDLNFDAGLAEYLNLSESEWTIIALADTQNATERFKFEKAEEIQNANLRIEVQSLIKTLNINRSELEDLIELSFVQTSVGSMSIQLEQGQEPNQFLEYLTPVNAVKVDRLYRFYRLFKKAPWTLHELNLLMSHLRLAGFSAFDGKQLNALACLRKIQLQFDIASIELGPLVAPFIGLPAEKQGLSLVEQILPEIDRHLFFASGLNMHHHAFNELDDQDLLVEDSFLSLARALNISEAEFLLLIDQLPFVQLNTSPEGNINIKDEQLAVYFRHVRLARAFQLDLISYLSLLDIYPQKQELNNLEGLIDWIAFYNKLKQSPLSLQLRVELLSQPVFEPENQLQRASLQKLHSALLTAETRLFRNDIFQSIEGLEEGTALDLFNLFLHEQVQPKLILPFKNSTVLEQQNLSEPNRFYLIQDYDSNWVLQVPNQIVDQGIMEALQAFEIEIKAVLQAFTVEQSLRLDLPVLMESDEDLFNFLAQNQWTSVDLEEISSLYYSASEEVSELSWKALFDLRNELSFWQTCMQSHALAISDFTFIDAHQELFGRLDTAWNKGEVLSQLDSYGQLKAAFNGNLSNQEQLQILTAILESQSAQQLLQEAAPEAVILDKQFAEQLARLFDTEISQLPSVWRICLANDASWLLRLLHLSQLLTFSKKRSMATQDLFGATSVLQGFGEEDFRRLYVARYKESWRQKYEAANERVITLKRDALVTYTLHRESQFKDSNDLYRYFLLDVSIEGCGRTTRVLSAISSLQLYVHRAQMQLELAADDLVEVNFAPQDSAAEWDWRRNYRVWEANRKVFLYPENYLEPDLRDNKTHLFKELEENLLQVNLTKESAEAAYKKYMTGFSSLAKMRISAVYYCKQEQNYYLFGSTLDQQPKHFFRKLKYPRIWTSWLPIDLPIDAKRLNATHYQGKLYLFWISIPTYEDGNQLYLAEGQQVILNFSNLNAQGNWEEVKRYDLYRINPGDFDADSPPQAEDTAPEIKRIKYDDDVYKTKVYPLIRAGRLYVQYHQNIRNEWRVAEVDTYQNRATDRPHIADESFKSVYRISTITKSQLLIRFIEDRYEDEDIIFPGGHDELNNWAIGSEQSISETFDNSKLKIFEECISNRPQDILLHLSRNAQVYLSHQLPNIENVHPENGIKRLLYRLSTSANEAVARTLFEQGLEKMLSFTTQLNKEKDFEIELNDFVELTGPVENRHYLDFKGAYGVYYRELFFHIPFLLANYLNATAKHKDADYWYRFIFDPTNKGKTPHRVWKYIEFFLSSFFQSNQSLEDQLSNRSAIEVYKSDPFNPHAIARLRTNSYMKRIVMKYVDNLIDWGDKLFRQDTYESINEALMLYVLASDILGDRPAEIGDCETAEQQHLTYENIGSAIQDSEFLIEIENGWQGSDPKGPSDPRIASNALIANIPGPADNDEPGPKPQLISSFVAREMNATSTSHLSSAFEISSFKAPEPQPEDPEPELAELDAFFIGFPKTAYAFCIPNNVDMLDYWNRVEDRLFKIRNCLNLEGISRQIPFFQPPIDPSLLVRAKAQGLNIEDILEGLTQELPPYRFTYLLEKARNYTANVQSLANLLLSALEKKDVEELQLLRSMQEQEIQSFISLSKEKQIEEAEENLNVIAKSIETVKLTRSYFSKLLTDAMDPDLAINEQEQIYKEKLEASREAQNRAQEKDRIAAALSIAPSISLGAFGRVGSPNPNYWKWGIDLFNLSYGTDNVKAIFSNLARKQRNDAEQRSHEGSLVNIDSAYSRRKVEWEYQRSMASKELKQLEQQQTVAEVRLSIAKHELKIHERQIAQTKELDDFYKNKFSNLGLYTYLSSELQKLHRQAYNLAYEMAQKAQKAFQFETDTQHPFIKANNWSPGKAGFLSSERLMQQLQLMESSYLESNRRHYEVTQSLSMMRINPLAILDLKTTGSCEFMIPEWAYDLFYPGQYYRSIKSVRISIPCVTGPNVNVACKLSLLRSWIRKEAHTDNEGNYIEINNQRNTSIASSNAQSDAGVFELNFRDERYIPFEKSGAISLWRLQLPDKFRAFNYSTIADVIFHISYTSKDDGAFRLEVEQGLLSALQQHSINQPGAANGLMRIFNLKHDFPNDWHKYIISEGQNFEASIRKQHFPYFTQQRNLQLNSVQLINASSDLILDASILETNDELETNLNGQESKTQVTITSSLPKNEVSYLIVYYGLEDLV